MSEANRGPTLLVKVMLGGYRDVGMSQCAAGSIDAVHIVDPGTKFFSQSVQRVCARDALEPKPREKRFEYLVAAIMTLGAATPWPYMRFNNE
jgi:hypothetical protein